MQRASRLLQIIQTLRNAQNPVRGHDLAIKLNISLRTLYRDISALILEGVPIRGEAGIGYILENGYDLPPLMFNEGEIEALILGLKFVQKHGDAALNSSSLAAFSKIKAVLPKNLRQLPDELSLFIPPNPMPHQDNIDLGKIRIAMRQNQKIAFDYETINGEKSRRKIWPFAIAYFDTHRWLAGFCETRQDYRNFRTDRMGNLEIFYEKFEKSRTFMMKEWQKIMKEKNSS